MLKGFPVPEEAFGGKQVRYVSKHRRLGWATSRTHFFFFLIYYLFLAVLGLCCCAQAVSSCGERGLLFIVVRGLLISVASLVAEHGL